MEYLHSGKKKSSKCNKNRFLPHTLYQVPHTPNLPSVYGEGQAKNLKAVTSETFRISQYLQTQ